MSGIFVLVPVLAAAPIVLTATSAAAAAMGFAVLTGQLDDLYDSLTQVDNCVETVQFDVAEAKGLTQLIRDQGPIVLERNDATICFRTVHGTTQLVVKGKGGQTRDELEALGRSMLDTLTQQYAYHVVVSDLKQRGFDKILETTDEDGTLRLQLRRWD